MHTPSVEMPPLETLFLSSLKLASRRTLTAFHYSKSLSQTLILYFFALATISVGHTECHHCRLSATGKEAINQSMSGHFSSHSIFVNPLAIWWRTQPVGEATIEMATTHDWRIAFLCLLCKAEKAVRHSPSITAVEIVCFILTGIYKFHTSHKSDEIVACVSNRMASVVQILDRCSTGIDSILTKPRALYRQAYIY